MQRSSLFCDTCDAPTDNQPMYGEVQCDDCAERAYERQCAKFYGGSDPITDWERLQANWKVKQ